MKSTHTINGTPTTVIIKRQLRSMPGGKLQENYSAKAEGFSQRVLFKHRCHSKPAALGMLLDEIKDAQLLKVLDMPY